MSTPVSVECFVWVVCCGRYIVSTEGRQCRLQGMDSAGIRYDILFNPGDRFRDSDGWWLEFGRYDTPPQVIYVKPFEPKHAIRIAEYLASGKRICRVSRFISLSFRKDRKTFTLMFRTKAVRSFS